MEEGLNRLIARGWSISSLHPYRSVEATSPTGNKYRLTRAEFGQVLVSTLPPTEQLLHRADDIVDTVDFLLA